MISIIIPVYNKSKYLKACFDSILNQTYKDFECIVVDDGSTDSSEKICDDYGQKDTRIKIIHKKNGGVSSARNTGIKHATGDYLLFIDSDDYIDDNFLETINKYTSPDYDIIQWGTTVEQRDLTTKLYSWPSVWNLKDLINTASVQWHSSNTKLIKRELILNNKIYFDEEIVIGEDLVFAVELYRSTNRILNIPNYCPYHYRFYDNTMEHITVEKLFQTKAAILKLEEITKNDNSKIWKEIILDKKYKLKLSFLVQLEKKDFEGSRNCFTGIKWISLFNPRYSLKRKILYYMTELKMDKSLICLYKLFKNNI